MTDPSPDRLLFPFRSMYSPLSSPTNMHFDEQPTKEPPQPASFLDDRLAPSHQYAERVFRRFHHHTISDLSTPDSTDSSPTTTISTVDDSSATEPSPGSSPESPPPSNFANGTHRPRSSDDRSAFFELQKQPPPRKGRNLKGLAVNTSRNPGRGSSSTASLPLPTGKIDPPTSVASPSFVKPMTPARRKPSNLGLTLLTPGASKAPPEEITLAMPPTPAFYRPGTLRQFQSSPSLPLFPQLSSQSHSSIKPARVPSTLDTILSPAQPEKEAAEEDESNYDVPLSQEVKPEAYPDGPICVYDPHIDLYLEPTAAQARQYDVIMNVASEVRNPFVLQNDSSSDEPDIRIDGGGGIQYAPKRDRGSTDQLGSESTQEGSPTTPKATPLNTTFSDTYLSDSEKMPEYIHIKWEHNSDIVPDLLGLVKLIDEKVVQGKRVLIHCQCGVSRSASLVVAYGLYKDPTMSVQEAYDAIKKRSKWIGPNMNLIMQLQEFRTSLTRGGLLSANRGFSPITPSSAFNDWPVNFPSQQPDRNGPLSANVAPLTKARTTESQPIVSPGPSSAPSGIQWPISKESTGQRPRAVSAVKPSSAYVDPAGHVIPVVPKLNIVGADADVSNVSSKETQRPDSQQESNSATPTEAVQSPGSAEFALTPLQPSPEFDPADSFGLMSPSSTEFATSPFDRSILLAQLGMGPVGGQQDSAPRRSASLRSKPKLAQQHEPASSDSLRAAPKLRGKVSAPNLREQQQLQSLQSSIEATLPQRSVQLNTNADADDALLSPRATEFTQNPFALSLSIPAEQATADGIAQPSDSDPRSPAQKGVSPITRSIFDVL